MLLSTHLFDRLDELADRVILLHRGEVVFDDTMERLRQDSSQQHFFVHLNGTAPEAVMDALRQAGIDSASVRRAEVNWEDLLRGPLAAGTKKEPLP